MLFKPVPFATRSFLQRVFNQYPEENAVIELNNLLASEHVRSITKDDIIAIEKKYNIDLQREFYLNLEEFYAVFFNYYLRNGKLGKEEKENLQHLISVLGISSDSVQRLNIKIGEGVYRAAHIEAIKDGTYTEQDKKALNNLVDGMGLPTDLTEAISVEVRKEFIKNIVLKCIEDERFSPTEDEKLQRTAKGLEVDLKYDAETKNYLDKLRLYWSLENEPLPVLTLNINLQKNEVCHLKISNVHWCEMRVVRHSTTRTGYSASVRIAKGIYLRSSTYRPQSYSTEQLKQIDSGTMYITNKRILFTGINKNHNIRFDKIVEFNPYKDGIEIGKDAGRNVFLLFRDKIDITCIMLSRLLDNHG